MVIDEVSIAIEVANPEEKNADHLVSPLGLPTEYYPFKRCQVPVGHSVLEVFLPLTLKSKSADEIGWRLTRWNFEEYSKLRNPQMNLKNKDIRLCHLN